MSSTKTTSNNKTRANTPAARTSQNDTSNVSIEVKIPVEDFEKLATTAAKKQISTELLISQAIFSALQETTKNKD